MLWYLHHGNGQILTNQNFWVFFFFLRVSLPAYYYSWRTSGLPWSFWRATPSLTSAWVLKTRQQAWNGVTSAKLHVTKPRLNTWLNYSFSSPRNGTSEHCEVTCLMNPCLPLKGDNLATSNLFFASVSSLSPFPLPLKIFHFVQLLRAPFYLLDGMLPNSWIIE